MPHGHPRRNSWGPCARSSVGSSSSRTRTRRWPGSSPSPGRRPRRGYRRWSGWACRRNSRSPRDTGPPGDRSPCAGGRQADFPPCGSTSAIGCRSDRARSGSRAGTVEWRLDGEGRDRTRTGGPANPGNRHALTERIDHLRCRSAARAAAGGAGPAPGRRLAEIRRGRITPERPGPSRRSRPLFRLRGRGKQADGGGLAGSRAGATVCPSPMSSLSENGASPTTSTTGSGP